MEHGALGNTACPGRRWHWNPPAGKARSRPLTATGPQTSFQRDNVPCSVAELVQNGGSFSLLQQAEKKRWGHQRKPDTSDVTGPFPTYATESEAYHGFVRLVFKIRQMKCAFSSHHILGIPCSVGTFHIFYSHLMENVHSSILKIPQFRNPFLMLIIFLLCQLCSSLKKMWEIQ